MFFKKQERYTSEQKQKFYTSKTLWFTLAALACFFIWAYEADIDQVTRAQGVVIASSRTQSIQSQDGGVIKDILVKEGQKVKKNEILVVFDRAKVEASYLDTRAKVAALRGTRARLVAEITGGAPKFNADINDYPQFKKNQLVLLEKRRNAINEKLFALNGLLSLAKKELQLNKPLEEKGDVVPWLTE